MRWIAIAALPMSVVLSCFYKYFDERRDGGMSRIIAGFFAVLLGCNALFGGLTAATVITESLEWEGKAAILFIAIWIVYGVLLFFISASVGDFYTQWIEKKWIEKKWIEKK